MGKINLKDGELLYINFRLKNYEEALKILEAVKTHNISTMTENYQNGVYNITSDEQFEAFLIDDLHQIDELISAIEINDLPFLEEVVETNINKTKTLLKNYGYKVF